MSDSLQITNLDYVLTSIEDAVKGEIHIEIEKNLKHNVSYRANWNLKDAGDKVLTANNIQNTVDRWAADPSKSWDNGENFLQDLARQIKTAYVDEVLTDEKTNDKFRDLERRAIRIEEVHL